MDRRGPRRGTWDGWREPERRFDSTPPRYLPAPSQKPRVSTYCPSPTGHRLARRAAWPHRFIRARPRPITTGARADRPRSRLRSPRHGRTPSTRIYVDTAGVGTPRRTSKKSQGKLLTITESHGHKGYMQYGVLHRERSNTRWALFWHRIWHLFGPDLIG